MYQTWQGLAAVYRAPEDTQLFAATGVVMTVSASVGEDVEDAAGALRDYATETAAIQVRLDDLRAQAVDLVAAAAAAQDESTTVTLDDCGVELDAAVAAQIAAWEAAQVRCANTIRGLTGAPGLTSYTSALTLIDHGGGIVITPPGMTRPRQEIFPIDPTPPTSSTGNPPVLGGPSILVNVPAPPGTGVIDGPGSFAPVFGWGVFADKATGGSPPRLPPKVRGKLGSLVGQAGETVSDVIRQRGGGAKQVGELQTGYGGLTLGEVARRAVAGDQDAEKAMKMVKQAGAQKKGGK